MSKKKKAPDSYRLDEVPVWPDIRVLSRRFLIYVIPSGTVFIGDRNMPLLLSAPVAISDDVVRRALPFYSTDTREEAEALVTRFCRLARDGTGLYSLNEPPADIDALGGLSEMFRVQHSRRKTT